MEISVKPTLLVIAVALVLAPAAGFAHGQAPQAAHGGRVQDAHGSWVEFVAKGDQVEIYVTDEHGDPIPASRISGMASVLIGGQPHKVQLVPAGGHVLTGKLPVPPPDNPVATVSLKIAGKPATARFASTG